MFQPLKPLSDDIRLDRRQFHRRRFGTSPPASRPQRPDACHTADRSTPQMRLQTCRHPAMRRIPVPRHDRRRTVHLRRPCGNTLLHHRRCIHGGRSDVRTRHRLISLRSRRTQSDSHRASTRSRRRCCRQRLRAPALRPHGSDLRRLNRMACRHRRHIRLHIY